MSDIFLENKLVNLTLFEHIDNLFTKKYKWIDFSEKSKKEFNVFIINRVISMDSNYIELINELQILSAKLNKEEIFIMYYNIFPKSNGKYVNKFIKNNIVDIWNPELVTIISNYFKCSLSESKEYLDTYKKTNTFNIVEDILKLYGKEQSEIKKLIKEVKK
jgi:DNA primase large subunit